MQRRRRVREDGAGAAGLVLRVLREEAAVAVMVEVMAAVVLRGRILPVPQVWVRTWLLAAPAARGAWGNAAAPRSAAYRTRYTGVSTKAACSAGER